MSPAIDAAQLETDLSHIPGDFLICRAGVRLEAIKASKTICGISGFDFEERNALMQGSVYNLVLKQDWKVIQDAVSACLAGENDAGAFCRVKHKSRGFVWVHARLKLLGMLDNVPVILATIMNASLDTQIQSIILDHSYTAIYVIDKSNYDILYANKPAVITEKSGAEYSSVPCFRAIHGRDSVCTHCPLLLEPSRQCAETEYYDEKSKRYYRLRSQNTVWFGRSGLALFINDITEAKLQHQDLVAETERLQGIINNIPAGIAVCRQDGTGRKLIAANRYLCDMLGLDIGSLLGDSLPLLLSLIHPDDRHIISESIEQLFIPGKRKGDFFRCRRFDSHSYNYFYAASSCVKGPDGMLTVYITYKNMNRQMKVEEALRASNLRLHLTIESTGLTLWEYDIAQHRIFWPDPGLWHYEMPNPVDNVPDSLLCRIDDSDRPAFLAMYKAIENGAPSASTEFWLKTGQHDSARCERVTYINTYDKSGKPLTAYGIGVNITAQRLAGQQYEKAIGELVAVSSKAVGAFHVNLTRNRCTTILGGSPELPRIESGATVDEFFARLSGLAAFPEEKAPLAALCSRQGLIAGFRAGRTSLSMNFRRLYNGDTVRWESLLITMVQNPKSADIEALVYAMDVDNQIKNEKIIERLTNAEFDFIALISTESGAFSYHSTNLHQYSFLPSDHPDYYFDEKGSLDRHLYRENGHTKLTPQALAAVKKALKKQTVIVYTADEKKADGAGSRRKQFSISYLSRDHKNILLIMTDITQVYEEEQRRLEELRHALEQAEKASAAKSEFLSNISHDMRTPLNGIIGFTGLALDCPSPPQVHDYLTKIQSSGSFLLALINDTLDLSRIESGRITISPSALDSSELLDSVITPIRSVASAKGIRFVVDTSRAPRAFIETDRLNCQKIILNLLSNAVKFTPPGGLVELIIEYIDAAPSAVPVPPAGAPAENTPLPAAAGAPDRQHRIASIIVRDTGIGIGPDFLPRLYEPFTQEHASGSEYSSGTGLGLSIVKQLVDLMGGSISVSSRPGAGTQFSLTIPFNILPACKSLQHSPPRSRRTLQDALILVCEDHPMNLEIARALLEKRGMRVITAPNGKIGLDVFLASKTSEISAILMDIRMPVMDGLAAARAIRALPRPDAAGIPIIAMTANAFEDDVKASRDAGINAHLAKPIDPELLYLTLERNILR